MRRSVMIGTGSHIPPRRVPNEDFTGNRFYMDYDEMQNLERRLHGRFSGGSRRGPGGRVVRGGHGSIRRLALAGGQPDRGGEQRARDASRS